MFAEEDIRILELWTARYLTQIQIQIHIMIFNFFWDQIPMATWCSNPFPGSWSYGLWLVQHCKQDWCIYLHTCINVHILLSLPWDSTISVNGSSSGISWAVGVIVLVHFNKIIYLPAPLLYCVFDRFVLLHKIPNICCFCPYFSMFISVFDLSVICTPNGKTAEPEYYSCASVVFWLSSLTVRSTNNWQIENRNKDKNGKYWGF